MPKYYPVMLDLRERPALVIGGDRLAAEKASALLDCGARVSILHPTFCQELLDMADQRRVTLRPKHYEPGDLAGAFVVVAMPGDDAQVQAIWHEAQERGQPLNMVDRPTFCSFILPSILRRGHLTIAVSTEGASPSLAKRVRQQLEETFSQAYSTYIDLAALARDYLRRAGVTYDTRDAFFKDFMDAPILTLLENSKFAQALESVADLLQAYHVPITREALARAVAEEQINAANRI